MANPSWLCSNSDYDDWCDNRKFEVMCDKCKSLMRPLLENENKDCVDQYDLYSKYDSLNNILAKSDIILVMQIQNEIEHIMTID